MIRKQFFIDTFHPRRRARLDLANPTRQTSYQLVLVGAIPPIKSGRRKITQGDVLLKMPEHQAFFLGCGECSGNIGQVGVTSLALLI